jgi:hypothetical protein
MELQDRILEALQGNTAVLQQLLVVVGAEKSTFRRAEVFNNTDYGNTIL